MAKTNSSPPSEKQDDPANVIAFHAGTEWSSQMHLDLNSHLVVHPSATFFLRVQGNSTDQGIIRDDDILIVDRALTPGASSTIVAVIDGVLVITPYQLLARYEKLGRSSTQSDSPVAGAESGGWGVVTHVIHKV